MEEEIIQALAEPIQETALSKEEQEKIVSEIVELANDSASFFGTENDRKKDDRRVYSNVEIFNSKQKSEMGDGRILSSVNPLPLYVHAISNLFLDNPFQASVDSTAEVNEKNWVDAELSKVLENSDVNGLSGEALEDIAEMGGSFFYITTDNNQMQVNLCYDPTSVIYDPNSKTLDGRDADFFGIVETISYEKAKQKAEDAGMDFPSMDRIPETQTFSFAGFKGTKKTLNLLHFYRIEDGGVGYYQIVVDVVIKHAKFESLSCLPVVPIYGQRFNDENKKLYKGAVRDVKDLCKIVNGCYSILWERVKDAQDPYWLLDNDAVENFVEDYESETVKYKRYRSKKKISETETVECKPPVRQVPEIITSDIMPQINDTLLKISKIIGVPEDGIGFGNSNVQQTAAEFIGKSSALVNNVSHFYRHLQQSIKHLCEVIVEMVCIYSGKENVYTVSITKGPADALKRERDRQQLSAVLAVAPDGVKPLILSEVVKTYDLPNSEMISKAILLTLSPEIKSAIAGTQDPAQLANQVALLTQQLAQANQQVEELTKRQQADVIANQAQIILARENNEAALRSKLIELEAKAAENEKDRAIEMAKLDASKQKSFADAVQKSREADIKARETAVKELEAAQKLRQEAEAKKAEMMAKMVASMPAPVEVQPVAVM